MTNPIQMSGAGSIDAFLAELKNSEKTSGNKSSNEVQQAVKDSFGLSDEAVQSITYSKTMFDLSYQTMKSVNSANGTELQEVNFSFKASYEFLQKVSGQSGNSLKNVSDNYGKANGVQEQKDSLAELKEYFSPEKTAKRILDVALSFYPSHSTFAENGDSESSRKSFADFIGGAIDEGFKQARGLIGPMPDDVESDVDKTHSIIFEGLDNFVKNGLSSDFTATGGSMEKIIAYRMEMKSEVNEVYSSSVRSYDSQGRSVPASDNSKVKTEA
ncbi:MAG: DUF5610 domain-containing protein [Candidatus Riflebacteria bacterium]|nr:DUF5610 domain-containing protein [Candidatus Riflebacteria bacterium]